MGLIFGLLCCFSCYVSVQANNAFATTGVTGDEMAALTSVVVTALVLFLYTSSLTLVAMGPLVTDIVSCKRECRIPGSLFRWMQDFRAVPNIYIYNRRMFYYQELSASLTV